MKSRRIAVPDINDQEADALYVMFKKMMDLKYDMEDLTGV